MQRGSGDSYQAVEGDEADKSGEFVQSLARGLAVIQAFDAQHPALTLSETAAIAGLTRAAARRFLMTLAALGYVRFDGKRFTLRPKILKLGYAYLSSAALPDVAQPHLEALSARVDGAACAMAFLDGTNIVYIARVPAKRLMAVPINVGTQFPAYATSMGRVLLAALSEERFEELLQEMDMRPLTPKTTTDRDRLREIVRLVRAQGYCVVDQELDVGLRTLAVPLHEATGEVIAALNVSVYAARGRVENTKRQLLPVLQAAASAIEADLKDVPPR